MGNYTFTTEELAAITWTTKDNKQLKLKEMTDSHLKNTIRYLRKKANEELSAYWNVGCMLHGEQAQYDWENQCDDVNEQHQSRHMLADAMEAEIERRR
jgi:hypothetical protein